MNIQNNEYLETKDLAIASYLYASGEVKLIGKYRTTKGEVFFKFSPITTAQNLVDLYWGRSAKPIQPVELFSSMRDMRDMIYGT